MGSCSLACTLTCLSQLSLPHSLFFSCSKLSPSFLIPVLTAASAQCTVQGSHVQWWWCCQPAGCGTTLLPAYPRKKRNKVLQSWQLKKVFWIDIFTKNIRYNQFDILLSIHNTFRHWSQPRSSWKLRCRSHLVILVEILYKVCQILQCFGLFVKQKTSHWNDFFIVWRETKSTSKIIQGPKTLKLPSVTESWGT